MSRMTRLFSTAALLAGSAGAALAQMAGGGMGSGSTPGMMPSPMGSQMMAGQMMKADMMSGMAGTMIQMHQIMEKMAGGMAQASDMKAKTAMADSMDGLAAMMKEMASQMRAGRMDPAAASRMNERLAALNQTLEAPSGKGSSR